MRIAEILYGKVHYIFEADEMPDWPPYPDGEKPFLIDITDYQEVEEGWTYHFDSGELEYIKPVPRSPGERIEPEPMPEPEPTEQELIQAELLLNQTQILINQEQQDTVLAELLLNQIGGI